MALSHDGKAFNIGVIGRFGGTTAVHKNRKGLRDSHFRPVDITTFADFFSSMQVEATITLSDESGGTKSDPITLRFRSLQDLSRDAVALQIPTILELEQLAAKLAIFEKSTEFQNPNALDLHCEETRKLLREIADTLAQPTSKDVVSRQFTKTQHASNYESFITRFELNNIELKALVRTVRQAIKESIRSELDRVLNLDDFSKLKANWTGLYHLLERMHDRPNVIVNVLDVSKFELQQDFDRSVDFSETRVFQKVYSNVLDTPGAVPFSLLVGAYSFDHHPDDVSLLRNIASIAASSFAPFIASASPAMFGIDRFEDLHNISSLAAQFSSGKYTSWNSLRLSDDAKYVALCLPHILLDFPPTRGDTNQFLPQEQVACNPAFILASQLAAMHTSGEWCPSKSLDKPFTIPWLRRDIVRDTSGNWIVRHSTDVVLADSNKSDELSKFVQPVELIHFGFLPICQVSDVETCFFGALNSIAATRRDDLSIPSPKIALSWLLSNLEYLLPFSAIARHIKSNLVSQNRLSDDDFKKFVEKMVEQCMPVNGGSAAPTFPFVEFDVGLQTSSWQRVVTVCLTLGANTLAPGQVMSFEIRG